MGFQTSLTNFLDMFSKKVDTDFDIDSSIETSNTTLVPSTGSHGIYVDGNNITFGSSKLSIGSGSGVYQNITAFPLVAVDRSTTVQLADGEVLFDEALAVAELPRPGDSLQIGFDETTEEPLSYVVIDVTRRLQDEDRSVIITVIPA